MRLDLSNNPNLEEIPWVIGSLPLNYLNVTGTGISHLPAEMEDRVKAGTLNLVGFTGTFILPKG